MRNFKIIIDGYIVTIGQTPLETLGTDCSDEEYEILSQKLQNPPIEDGYYFKLNQQYQWERFVEEEQEIREPQDDDIIDEQNLMEFLFE